MTTDPGQSRAEREVLELLRERPGATAGQVAAATRRKKRAVHRILEGLAEKGVVERAQLPTGHVGYRRPDEDLRATGAALEHQQHVGDRATSGGVRQEASSPPIHLGLTRSWDFSKRADSQHP